MGQAVVRVNSGNASDWIVLTPFTTTVEHEDFRFEGRCGVARLRNDGSTSLALLDGKQIGLGTFRVDSVRAAVEATRCKDGTIRGTTFGEGGEVLIYPGDAKALRQLTVKIENKKVSANREGDAVRFKVGPGRLQFQIVGE